MLQLAHEDRNSRQPSPQKPFSSVAYRRGSVPEIHSAQLSTLHLFHNLLPVRPPLASLHCQSALSTAITDLDHQMSVPPRSAFLGYPHPDPQDRDRTSDHLRYIGRPIMPTHVTRDAVESTYPSARRRSQTSMTPLRHPPISSRATSRRPSHGSPSFPSTRRPSLPTIYLQPSPPTAAFTTDTHAHLNSGSDDLYSNLSSFTFGSARTNHADQLEMINPFQSPSCNSADRTPRPSVSGPSSASSHASSSTRSRTPRTRGRGLEDEASRADDEADEAEHQTRAKMRAMNDGTRRPSLPVNVRPSSASRSPPRRLSVATSAQRSGASGVERGRDHTPDASETESETGARDEDCEREAEAADFDTDVEIDYRNPPTPDDTETSDTASHHTFGGDYRGYVYNTGFRVHSDDRMSVSETSEAGDDMPEPPVVTTTEYVVDDQGNMAMSQGPRRSLPWNVTGVAESDTHRDREGSLATLTGTPLDSTGSNMLGVVVVDPLGAHASSRRQSIQQQMESSMGPQDASDPFSGFNLNYILGARAGEDGDRHSWHSAASSWMQVDPHHAPPVPLDGLRPSADFDAFDFQGWGAPVTGVSGRRPSTVTVGSVGEDAFTRHLKRYDPVSSTRAMEWTFKRESADGISQDSTLGTRWVQSPARVITSSSQEIWRQALVGRFKVDRMLIRNADDPSKPQSQRVNARHIVDPYSKGNTYGGPMAVVHKHSRAVAFSIFRKYDLYNSRHSTSRAGSTSMPTSSSVLLATKRVQEQYTSTRTTSQLNSHGLLKDGDARSRPQTASSTSTSGASHGYSSDAAETQRPKGRRDKGKGKESAVDASGSSSQSSGVSSADEESSVQFTKPYSPSSCSGPSAPVSPTIAETHYAYSVTDSDLTAARSSAGPSYSKHGSPPPTASSGRATTLGNMWSADDEDEHLPPRTSHAEAFATLDQNSIDYFRGRTEQRVGDHESHSRSIADRLRRRLLGQNPVKVSSRPSSGPPTAALDGHYTPPWMTMAPRSKVEERDRVIQNLNESFKDVGLLPSFKPKGIGKKRSPGNDDKVNIFSHVPSNSLHMLLPLWPGETDARSTTNEDPAVYKMPVEERQYLLIYYIPLLERAKKNVLKQENKKRSRSGARGSHSPATTINSKTIVLPSFSVCARLISYQDLLGTGVRIPIDGLSVTGPMAEAIQTLPSAAIQESRLETPCAIIGICDALHKGVEFLPEGLAKVGLAVARPSSTTSSERFMRPLEAEEEELIWDLTPVGRAAVEMAWLGSLAVTSFGPESSPAK